MNRASWVALAAFGLTVAGGGQRDRHLEQVLPEASTGHWSKGGLTNPRKYLTLINRLIKNYYVTN
jgi:hypothetical protein